MTSSSVATPAKKRLNEPNTETQSFKSKFLNQKNSYIILSTITKVFFICLGIGLIIFSIFGGIQPEYRLSWALTGLLIGYGGDRIGEMFNNLGVNLSREKELKEFKDISDTSSNNIIHEFEEMKDYIGRVFNSEWIDSRNGVDEIVKNLSEKATKVRNTFISIDAESGHNNKAIDIYEQYLKEEGKYWYDIVSLSELYSERYKNINPFKDQSIEQKKRDGMHQIAVMNHSFPIVNFIIFDFPGSRPREVLFGWGQGRHHGSETVFRTTDSKITQMFENLFGRMWEKRHVLINVDYTQKTPFLRLGVNATPRHVDKEGLWFTHAYQDSKQIRSALFRIKFLAGLPIVEGIVSDSDASSREEIIDHRHPNKIDHSFSKIYIEYNRRESGNISKGFVLYSFSSYRDTDLISGFFTEGLAGSRAEIIGCRVDVTKIKAPLGSLESLREAKTIYDETIKKIWKTENPNQGAI